MITGIEKSAATIEKAAINWPKLPTRNDLSQLALTGAGREQARTWAPIAGAGLGAGLGGLAGYLLSGKKRKSNALITALLGGLAGGGLGMAGIDPLLQHIKQTASVGDIAKAKAVQGGRAVAGLPGRAYRAVAGVPTTILNSLGLGDISDRHRLLDWRSALVGK